MQAFSDMRRNRTHQTYLTLFGLAGILVLCQIMSSLYPWLPTFVGVVFAYLILEFEHREVKAGSIALGFAYLCFYDASKGFYLFSYVILFILVYRFALLKIQTLITCDNCILASYVIVAYIGHYLLNCFLAYLNNETFPYFSNYYFYSIALDSLLSFMLFRVSR
jgi:cell shape-determining protein MreD